MPVEAELNNGVIIRGLIADIPDATFSVMNREQSQQVIDKLKDKPGDPELLKQLILGHVPLVFSEAIKYQDKHLSVNPHEILSEAMLTLVRAAIVFNPNKNIMFSTYLVSALKINLQNKTTSVYRLPMHTPTNVIGLLSKFSKINAGWVDEELCNNEESAKYGVNVDRFRAIQKLYKLFLEGSLQLTTAVEEVNKDQQSPLDIVMADEESAFKKQLILVVKAALNHLPLVYPRAVGAKYKRVVELVLNGYSIPQAAKYISVSKTTAALYYSNALNSLLYLVLQKEPKLKNAVKEYFNCSDEDIKQAYSKHRRQVMLAFQRSSA